MPALAVAVIAANLPDGCESAQGSAVSLVACVRVVESQGVRYEAFAIDRPVARRLLLPSRPAVDPACADFGATTECGVETNEEADRPTTVRPIDGLDPARLLWAAGDEGEPHVVLIPFDDKLGWLLSPAARRFVNRHLDKPLPEDLGVSR